MNSFEIVCFIVGAILLGVALFGGGLEIKEIKIPKAGRPSRIIAGCLGTVFILIALSIAGVIKWPPDSETPDANAVFLVSAALGTSEDAKEMETQLLVALDSKEAARLLLDSNSPAQSRSVTVPRPGYHDYSITGYTRWTTDPNRRVPVSGSGKIKIQNARAYTVRLEAVPSRGVQNCKAYLRKAD